MEKEYNRTDCYYIFVLGYDLLQDYFKEQEENDCDVIFEKACEIYEEYTKSEETENYSISGYYALVEFLRNKNYI